jgi:hypothetical protein
MGDDWTRLGLDRFLSANNAERASHTLDELLRHDLGGWPPTGGELHGLRRASEAPLRELTEIVGGLAIDEPGR